MADESAGNRAPIRVSSSLLRRCSVSYAYPPPQMAPGLPRPRGPAALPRAIRTTPEVSAEVNAPIDGPVGSWTRALRDTVLTRTTSSRSCSRSPGVPSSIWLADVPGLLDAVEALPGARRPCGHAEGPGALRAPLAIVPVRSDQRRSFIRSPRLIRLGARSRGGDPGARRAPGRAR